MAFPAALSIEGFSGELLDGPGPVAAALRLGITGR